MLGIFRTVASDQEKFDKQERAKRLRLARTRAGLAGPKAVYDASEGAIDINLYKGHESGRNGFSVSEGRRYADLFGVPLTWLYLGIGDERGVELPGATVDLRRAFASVVDAPEATQTQVINFINFQLNNLAQSQPIRSPAETGPSSPRPAKEPVR